MGKKKHRQKHSKSHKNDNQDHEQQEHEQHDQHYNLDDHDNWWDDKEKDKSNCHCKKDHKERESVIWWPSNENHDNHDNHDNKKDDHKEYKRCRNLGCMFKCTCS